VKDARPILLSIEKIDLPGERRSKAPSDQRGSWVGLSQFDRVDIQHATFPRTKANDHDYPVESIAGEELAI
jgi:hypothetical protein